MADWIATLPAADLEDEDLLRWDHAGRSYALCLDEDGDVHCLDGICPRDGAHLAGGLIDGTILDCPVENCRYDLATGAALDGGRPVTVYPARVTKGMVEVQVP